jgi:calcineurin-like phosphoesterase family protein
MTVKHPAGAVILLGLFACNDQSTQTTEPNHPPQPAPTADFASTAATVTLAAAGDIASCSSGNQSSATARLVDRVPGMVLTLGDNAYPDGTTANYRCYNTTWGRFKSRTHPAPGNHDYHQSGAPGYFSYFGSAAGPRGRGYYSFNAGAWHIVSLNSESNLSAETTWLKADLAASRAKCTLAYWHQPLFTSGAVHPPATRMRPLYTILYNAGAELVLSGHNHQYERFAPQTPTGGLDRSRGIVQFVAGTGGNGLYGFRSPMRNSQVRYRGYGVLRLELRPSGYTYSFVPVSGSFRDTGSGSCH